MEVLERLTAEQRSQYECLQQHKDKNIAQRYLQLLQGDGYGGKPTSKRSCQRKDQSSPLARFEGLGGVGEAIAQLKDLRQVGRGVRMKERQILLWLQETECHKRQGYEYPSFQQFLVASFEADVERVYRKELVVASKEILLGIPVGTYSQWEFLPLARFRTSQTVGQTGRSGKPFEKGDRTYGTKVDPEQVRRLRECWKRAVQLAKSPRPERSHILAAAKELSKKYALKVKDRESLVYWKRRAIAAEEKLQELEERLKNISS